MQLRAYLVSHSITIATFAAALGVTVQAVHRYVNGERMPKRDVMARIAVVTNGKVTANDFFEPAEAA